MKKFKLVTLLGIRPDYIRMFKLIPLLDESKDLEHIMVHSGQHYDEELFGVFLKEFGVRRPDIDLGIGLSLKERGESNHAYQLALLTERVYDMLQEVKPDAVMYLGDTNTVLSAPTVAREGIPVIHIEAGGRSFDWRMPEEKNRVVIDHVSDALYSYLDRYKELLVAEGVADFRVKVIGNIIADAINEYESIADKSDVLERLGIKEKEFVLVTLHREENTSDKVILERKLADILRFAKEKRMPIVLPLMPRTKAAIERFGIEEIIKDKQWIITPPLGFFDFLKLEKTARLAVSDSGTVQEETLVLGTPCVIARRSTERPETIWAGATILEGFEGKDTLYNSMVKAWDMPIGWDRTVLNPEGGSPSQRAYDDLIEKVKSGYFEHSRDFERIKDNPLARKAYGGDE
ncbi:MAG: UDP-N-acetylglucosamine 2-epimerase (non-hydrolyzing) [Candidatus Colwellbacteria bacterium]